jgi:hypothetical protein
MRCAAPPIDLTVPILDGNYHAAAPACRGKLFGRKQRACNPHNPPRFFHAKEPGPQGRDGHEVLSRKTAEIGRTRLTLYGDYATIMPLI